MNILIPMAGRGQRFKDEGYKKPKPMIDVLGQPMISKVLDGLGCTKDDTIIFLCLTEFLDKYANDLIRIAKSHSSYEIIPVNGVTDGAACTALLAKYLINNDEKLIIVDTDHTIEDYQYIQEGIRYFDEHSADGGLWCHLADSPKWSFTDYKGGKVVRVAEKQPISILANTGDYYFKKGKYFVEAAEKMIERKDKTNAEYYVAPVFNHMILEELKVVPYLVNFMRGFGTPLDLGKYCDLYK